MDDVKMTIPYVIYEGEQVRNERTVKRLIVALIVTVALMFVSNTIWLVSWMQFDYIDVTDSISVDAKDGIANYIENDGVINNGEDSSSQTGQGGD